MKIFFFLINTVKRELFQIYWYIQFAMLESISHWYMLKEREISNYTYILFKRKVKFILCILL